ncbi:hypothetical protein SLNWT_5084 [Streptomyces albus]|uniref:Uncharacterized protein n=1 Tax=Streptomyces albus (strain ATCC 21838 / DSM 41398 / FERM P-419 / JCM 4703 / NBRC 107858) TaxID=1081613 RepID=A0A0B5F1J8_STRA4|nr:hypothetical protein SLNWT_5084 [Streptomyces albus]AOU79764.1 hypothetical protein SLNHY_5073 [Streptomyces albus]AYN35489.1 hypothetical protein DUI70_4990 [Streptomyces albus]
MDPAAGGRAVPREVARVRPRARIARSGRVAYGVPSRRRGVCG